MLKIGIVVLIGGYFIALITQDVSSSTPVFWLGFLFILKSKQLANPENYWAKGAMWALLGNVLLYFIVFFSWGNVVTRYLLKYVLHPITFIAATFPPKKYVQNPAGSITEITTLILVVTYRFLDICTHISIGSIIGKLFIKQKSS